MATGRFNELDLTGHGIDGTPSGDVMTVSVDESELDHGLLGGLADNDHPQYQLAAGSPVDATAAWLPLTTVLAGVPQLVWDADNSIIPTLVPIT